MWTLCWFFKIAGTALIEPKIYDCFQEHSSINQSRIKSLKVRKTCLYNLPWKIFITYGTWEYLKRSNGTDRKQQQKQWKNSFPNFKHSTKSQLAHRTVTVWVSHYQLQDKILLLQSKTQHDALSYYIACSHIFLFLSFGTGNKAVTVQHSAIPAGMPAHSDWWLTHTVIYLL